MAKSIEGQTIYVVTAYGLIDDKGRCNEWSVWTSDLAEAKEIRERVIQACKDEGVRRPAVYVIPVGGEFSEVTLRPLIDIGAARMKDSQRMLENFMEARERGERLY